MLSIKDDFFVGYNSHFIDGLASPRDEPLGYRVFEEGFIIKRYEFLDRSFTIGCITDDDTISRIIFSECRGDDLSSRGSITIYEYDYLIFRPISQRIIQCIIQYFEFWVFEDNERISFIDPIIEDTSSLCQRTSRIIAEIEDEPFFTTREKPLKCTLHDDISSSRDLSEDNTIRIGEFLCFDLFDMDYLTDDGDSFYHFPRLHRHLDLCLSLSS